MILMSAVAVHFVDRAETRLKLFIEVIGGKVGMELRSNNLFQWSCRGLVGDQSKLESE